MHCEEYADEYLGRDWYPALFFLTPSGQALEACVAPCDAKHFVWLSTTNLAAFLEPL
jgi:hypothetical protein